MKYYLLILLIIGSLGCNEARIASHNLSKAGDMFELNRRVVFYNGITDSYMLVIEGRLSIQHDGLEDQLEVTVRTVRAQFKKHTLGLSDNVTYFCEQLDPAGVDVYHYKVYFKPAAILPDVDILTEGKER